MSSVAPAGLDVSFPTHTQDLRPGLLSLAPAGLKPKMPYSIHKNGLGGSNADLGHSAVGRTTTVPTEANPGQPAGRSPWVIPRMKRRKTIWMVQPMAQTPNARQVPR